VKHDLIIEKHTEMMLLVQHSMMDFFYALPMTVFAKWGCIISKYEKPLNNNKHAHSNSEKVGESKKIL